MLVNARSVKSPLDASTSCPSDAVLVQWLLGTLSPEETRQIGDHVRMCPKCELASRVGGLPLSGG